MYDESAVRCAFGKTLRNIRKYRSLSLEQLAKKSQVGASQLSRFECGLRTPDLLDLQKLSDALEVSYTELMGKPKWRKKKHSTYLETAEVLAGKICGLASADREIIGKLIERLLKISS